MLKRSVELSKIIESLEVRKQVENQDLNYLGNASDLIDKQRKHGKEPWENPSPHYLTDEVYMAIIGDLEKDFLIYSHSKAKFSTQDITLQERVNSKNPHLTHVNATHLQDAIWNASHLTRSEAKMDASILNNGFWNFKKFVKPDEVYDLFLVAGLKLKGVNGHDLTLRDYSRIFTGPITAELWQGNELYASFNTFHKSVRE